MTSPLITGYVSGLYRRLPAALAGEAAAGLLEAYEQHLTSGASDHDAASAALAEYGDLPVVVGEFIRQAPGRRTARLLLATGPAAGACWAAALVLARAWTWPVPPAIRLSFGSVLLLAAAGLAAAATSRHSYQRTRLTALAAPVILTLDAAAVTAALLAGPPRTWALGLAVGLAVAVSLGRIAFTVRTLPRLAIR